jgi:threonyl-tRNA synthetase
LGNLERFFSVLIEHYTGAFPVGLSPKQVALIPIADRHIDYAKAVAGELRKTGLRVMVDDRSERMNTKIRDSQNQEIPYMLVIGDKEIENNQIALRLRSGGNLGPIPVSAFIDRAKDDIIRKI